MKTNSILRYWTIGWLAVLLISGLVSCGKKTVVIPLADQLKKVWTAQSVKENAAVVYIKDGASNVRNYGLYRLDLSSPPTVSFTDYDGITVSGPV